MVKGKLYKTAEELIVMCTSVDSSKYFEGVILKSEECNNVIGIHSKFLLKDNFVEYIGQLDLNNIHIKE